MKKSNGVFPKVNEGSLRLNPEAKSFRLTGLHWKDAPQLILGLVSSLVLLTGINLAYAAVFSKDLLIDEGRPDLQHDSLQIIQETVSTSEALLQAMQENDQDAIQRCRKKLAENEERQKQLFERKAQRLAEHAIAEKALRKRYGATSAGLIVAGLSMLFIFRSRVGPRHHNCAEPSDAADSR